MAQASGWLTYFDYGGILMAFNDSHVRLFAPSPNEDG